MRSPRRVRIVRGVLIAYLGAIAIIATAAISVQERDLVSVLSITSAVLAVAGIVGGPVLWLMAGKETRS
jgi:hypothetical protein